MCTQRNIFMFVLCESIHITRHKNIHIGVVDKGATCIRQNLYWSLISYSNLMHSLFLHVC